MAVSSGMVSSTTKAFLRMDMISTVICDHFGNLISRNISKQTVFVDVIYTLYRGHTLGDISRQMLEHLLADDVFFAHNWHFSRQLIVGLYGN
jgi:hypothetical protein